MFKFQNFALFFFIFLIFEMFWFFPICSNFLNRLNYESKHYVSW